MPNADDKFSEVFSALRPILAAHESGLSIQEDAPARYSLETSYVMKNGQKLWFGAVEIKKRYVSFHLMPVYVDPSLLDGMSDGLKKRMQGKSCFNFSKPDETLFAELAELTARGLQSYRDAGRLA